MKTYYVVKKDLLTILIHQLKLSIPTDEENMIARDVMHRGSKSSEETSSVYLRYGYVGVYAF